MSRWVAGIMLCAVCLSAALGLVAAQTGHESGLPDPIPPPLPPRPKPKDAGEYEPIVRPSDAPWGLEVSLLDQLYRRAADYADFARRFTCDETARRAEYDETGAAAKEQTRRYGYLLVKGDIGLSHREYRQEFAKDGSLKPREVEDEEPFPPAYLWVFLFSRFNEPHFSYRYVADRFDGFDWVHEIQFKGSLPFSNGKDIREWEGVVLVDAVTYSPLEIRAEPSGQAQRIEALYQRYQSSFNILGMRTAPRPLGYRARVQFRHRDAESGLRFPTEVRYDTFRALGRNRIVPVSASVRTYDRYRIFGVENEQRFASP